MEPLWSLQARNARSSVEYGRIRRGCRRAPSRHEQDGLHSAVLAGDPTAPPARVRALAQAAHRAAQVQVASAAAPGPRRAGDRLDPVNAYERETRRREQLVAHFEDPAAQRINSVMARHGMQMTARFWRACGRRSPTKAMTGRIPPRSRASVRRDPMQRRSASTTFQSRSSSRLSIVQKTACGERAVHARLDTSG